MKNLYDAAAYQEIKERLEALSPVAAARWGKMNAAQMLAHCSGPFRIALSDTKMPRMFISYLFGWLARRIVTSDKPYKQGLPTAKELIVNDERDFEKEKQTLAGLMEVFHRHPEKAVRFPHPFFGTLTREQWGKSQYKHMDHHLRQFGA